MSKSPSLFDPIRRVWVASTPEEIIRQKLLKKMIDELGYPKGLLCVEKKIGAIGRRVDLLCYAALKEGLSPLLLVECKADFCNKTAEQQLFGYNASVCAPFLCLASNREVRTLWKEGEKILFVPFLPKFNDLLKKVQ